ncbi:catalase [Lasiosphaeria miniovina]|uniref:Catalase n=1 Tax=Lasiosphaeria miniovina TaxID=1954250 RepID=A0AA40AV21_9PEZI|nr:catalase [Lasiosphaeria miniovina]KAK0722560.1 catalase [Lasiosphaeria miniovina]
MASDTKPASTFRYGEKPVYTTSNGCPVESPQKFQRISNGPVLLQDFHLLDLLAHFDRERIPERVVHAKGAGAYGGDLTSVDMLNGVGKKTPLVARFSTVGGEKGSADTPRDPRGFSLEFYTQEGNWDWVYNNTPVFFIRDPTNFPVFIHTQKRNPQANLKDATMFWDYLSTHQESVHQVMTLFSDRGTPYSYRHMHGYSGHTHKFTKPDGSFVYVQTHLRTDQGVKTFTNEEAGKMAAENPDWNTQDLFEAIQRGEYPSWSVFIQWNIFDLTKVWPQAEVPLRPVGKFTLNRNPESYFAEIEQVAFSPSHLVPGGWLFSYPDTQRHRLGVNYQQIPVNAPLNAFNPFQRDGAMAVNGNYGANPGYPSSYHPLTYKPVSPALAAHEQWAGSVVNAVFAEVGPADYVQAAALWQVLGRTPGQQDNFVYNVAVHLCGAHVDTRERTYGMFANVDAGLGARIREETEKNVKK